MQFSIGNTKWQHREEEDVVVILAEFALQKGAWSAISWSELVKRTSVSSLKIEPNLAFAVHHLAETGDVRIVTNTTDYEIYVVPLPELGKTIINKPDYWSWYLR